MVEPASRAALAMGSHGLLIEVADFSLGVPNCDALQAIDATTLARIVEFACAHGKHDREHAHVA
jgi:3-deoxy-D-arabino-heptulosonate 7-phosphate (DAHP) synthase